MWQCILALNILSYLSESATIYGISTIASESNENDKKGSFRGGTSLYIRGDFESGDPSIYNVYVGLKKCEIVHFNTDSSTIHCMIPPSDKDFSESYNISIFSSYESITIDPSVEAIFTYDYERTPWILYVNPTEACPEDEIAFVGKWGTNDWLLLDSAKIAENMLEIISVDESTSSYWRWHKVSCIVKDNVHGDTEATITLKNGFGNSALSWVGYTYRPDGESFGFRTLARIDRISYNEGSSAGGLDITIYGVGFSTNISDYNVTADGASCNVHTVFYNKIVCTTSASEPSNKNFYLGNAGLRKEYWESSSDFADLVGVVDPDQKTVIATPQIKNNEGNYTKIRLFGAALAQTLQMSPEPPLRHRETSSTSISFLHSGHL